MYGCGSRVLLPRGDVRIEFPSNLPGPGDLKDLPGTGKRRKLLCALRLRGITVLKRPVIEVETSTLIPPTGLGSSQSDPHGPGLVPE